MLSRLITWIGKLVHGLLGQPPVKDSLTGSPPETSSRQEIAGSNPQFTQIITAKNLPERPKRPHELVWEEAQQSVQNAGTRADHPDYHYLCLKALVGRAAGTLNGSEREMVHRGAFLSEVAKLTRPSDLDLLECLTRLQGLKRPWATQVQELIRAIKKSDGLQCNRQFHHTPFEDDDAEAHGGLEEEILDAVDADEQYVRLAHKGSRHNKIKGKGARQTHSAY